MPTSGTTPRVTLPALGWDDRWAALAATQPDLSSARVTRVDRGVCTVVAATGLVRASLSGAVLDVAAKAPEQGPCAGDWVLLRSWPDSRVTLESVLPRRTSVVRAEAGRRARAQVLAANHDIAAVTASLDQMPSLTKIERLLALAADSGGRPVVVLTKADMAADVADVAADVRGAAPGVLVIAVSAVSGLGIPALRTLIATHGTLALVGSSGAGKSTLVNALVGAPVLATRALRPDGRGRHTTVRRELVVLPSGGCVIDTPGLREIGLFETSTGLVEAFADINALAGECRFGDCSHATEPGCAVRAAVETGTLAPRRLESWRKLRGEQAKMASRRSRHQPRARVRP